MRLRDSDFFAGREIPRPDHRDQFPATTHNHLTLRAWCGPHGVFYARSWLRIVGGKFVHAAGAIRLRRGFGGRVDSGYRCIRGNPKRRFQHARGTKPFRRVRKDLRAAFAANSEYSDHCPRLGVSSHLVLRKILSDLMRESQQSDNATRFRYRRESQRYWQFPRAITIDSFAEIDGRPAKRRFRSSRVAPQYPPATAPPARLPAID